MLPQEISPFGLTLGPLADPAFASAAALLATRPELVRQLFVTQARHGRTERGHWSLFASVEGFGAVINCQ